MSARLLAEPATTGDHATIGSMFVFSSLLFALGAAIIGVLIRSDSVTDDTLGVFSSPDSWFQMWTLHRLALLLMVLAPLMLGLAMAAVPDLIGASNLAFPRAALGSFWLWLIGSSITAAALAGGGWGSLSDEAIGGTAAAAADSDAISLTLLGTTMTIASLLLGAVIVATTVISLRKPGMSLLDIPPFVWSMLVTTAIWLLTFPIAVANIVLVYADLQGREPISFGVLESGGIWLQLDWITEQPAVYALAIPVLGIAAEMVRAATRGDATAVTISETGQDTTGQDTTSNADQSSSADNTAGNSPEASQSVSAKPMPNRRAVMAAGIGLFGLLSIGGWSQDYFTSGMTSDTAVSTPDAGYNYGPVYVAFGLAALLPILTATVGTAASLYQGGRRSLAALSTTRLRGALAGLILLAGAVAIGALRVIEPFELLERSTTSGIFSAVTAAGLAAGASMIWHWSSRLLGSPAAEPLGRIAVGLTCVGGVMLAGADAISGFLGRSDLPLPVAAIIKGSDVSGPVSDWDTVSVLASVSFAGSLILAGGVLSLFIGVVFAVFRVRSDTPARRSSMTAAQT